MLFSKIEIKSNSGKNQNICCFSDLCIVICKLKSAEKDFYRKNYDTKLHFNHFLQAFCMTTKPLNIAAKIILMSRQYNLNTRNLKIIPYNQEKMRIKHDALFLHISIYHLIRLCLTFCSLWRCKKQTADRNTPVIGKSPGSDTIKPLVARERVVKREMSHFMTKQTKWHVRPAKTQIRLGGWADSQADLSLRWAHSHFVGFVMRRLKSPQTWTHRQTANTVISSLSSFRGDLSARQNKTNTQKVVTNHWMSTSRENLSFGFSTR